MTNRHGRRTSAERGVAAVEFALLLPVLILFLLGIIEFGKGYNQKVTLTHAAREGVRALVVGEDATAAVTGSTPGYDWSQTGASITADPCGSANAGDPVQVILQYPYSYTIPFFGSATVTMNETATMRCGG